MATAEFVGLFRGQKELAAPGGSTGHPSPSHQSERQKAQQNQVDQRNQQLLTDVTTRCAETR